MYVTRVKEACMYMYYTFDDSIDFAYRCYRVRMQDFVDRIVLIKRTNSNTILCAYHIVMRQMPH